MAESATSQMREEISDKGAPDKPRPFRLLTRQKAMNRMLIALAPLAVAAVYFFGWRVVGVLAVVFAVGYLTELITARRRGQASCNSSVEDAKER